MKKTLGMIILMFMCLAAFSATAENSKATGNPEVFELIALYTQPSLYSDVLGLYYPGAPAQLIGSENGWSGVLVGKDPGAIAGYVQGIYLMDGWLGKPDDIYPVQYDEVWSGTAASVSVHIFPDESAPSPGEYLNGTIVRRIGECGEWSHIEFGGYGTVFIKTEYLQPTNRCFQKFAGVEPIGFVGFTALVDIDMDMSTRFFPSMDAETIEFEHRDATGDFTLTLIAELDGWCQVYRSTELTMGFMPSENLAIYTFDKLFLDDDISLSPGRYIVDKDMPSGLYEYYVETGEAGCIIISGSGTRHDRLHEVKGKSIYSLYIPPNATVELTSGI